MFIYLYCVLFLMIPLPPRSTLTYPLCPSTTLFRSLPGLIDAHLHVPQTQVIASYGAQLMDWLERYALLEEQRFAEPKHSVAVARFFLDELARNGTTTAAVYGTVQIGRASRRESVCQDG